MAIPNGADLHNKPDDLILALDIGTRKVAGLIVRTASSGEAELVAAEIAEHQTRAMWDGQIHDVPSVAALIRRVVDRLQERCQVKLEKAAVAAAGRALRTQVGTASARVSPFNRITEQDVLALELESIVSAQRILARESAETTSLSNRYFCVGYSVCRYELDGNKIGNLVGQRGEVIGVETIATFLPRVVVDSLCSAVEQAGLEVASITLEPIAAIAVAIPPTMRQLNLALVDIGAGTSDIAITSEGEIKAYGMVPIAGDEITEELCQRYLLDFAEGERVKRLIGSGGQIEYEDVLGTKCVVDAQELLEAIDKRTDQLAQAIADKIIELNRTEPQAVICIGGGSLTPGLPAKLAARLGLSPGRVAVRGHEIVRNVSGVNGVLEGPAVITPLGIAVTARHRSSFAFFSVKVNGHTARLLHLGTPTVADAVIASGIGVRQLHGRPGPGMTVEINGKVHVIKGLPGRPARFLVNGEPALLDTVIHENDEIQVIPPSDGEQPSLTVKDLVDYEEIQFVFRGQKYTIEPRITRDGEAISLNTKVRDRDRIAVEYDASVAGVLKKLVGDNDKHYKYISYTLNGRACTAQVSQIQYFVNGRPVSGEYRIRPGDVVDFETREIQLCVSDVFTKGREKIDHEVRVILNGREISLYDGNSNVEVSVNGQPSSLDHRISDGDEILVKVPEPPTFILATVLEYLDLDTTVSRLKESKRGTVQLRVNGEPATFSTVIKNGDVIDISID
mgnify:FL=1